MFYIILTIYSFLKLNHMSMYIINITENYTFKVDIIFVHKNLNYVCVGTAFIFSF